MSRVRARVYYTLSVLMLAVPSTVACAQERATSASAIDPAMTKGTVTAPVTIVEFSDYQ